MPRKSTERKSPPKVPPRQKTSLNLCQERFCYEYLVDMDRAAAYIRAGYEAQDEVSAYRHACRLLRKVEVKELLDRLQGQRVDRLEVDGDWAVTRWKMVYQDAWRRGDLKNAIAALVNISKYLGLYEKHNLQRKYTQEDLERLKGELEQAGMDFKWVNFSEN